MVHGCVCSVGVCIRESDNMFQRQRMYVMSFYTCCKKKKKSALNVASIIAGKNCIFLE